MTHQADLRTIKQCRQLIQKLAQQTSPDPLEVSRSTGLAFASCTSDSPAYTQFRALTAHVLLGRSEMAFEPAVQSNFHYNTVADPAGSRASETVLHPELVRSRVPPNTQFGAFSSIFRKRLEMRKTLRV